MSELTLYDTEGQLAYPPDGGADEALASRIDQMATIPPWPIARYEGEGDRLLQRILAMQRRKGTSGRPNNFYVVVEPARLTDGGLNAAATELERLFHDGWERQAEYDDAAVDPEIVRETWSADLDPVSLPAGTEAALAEKNSLIWHAPDLRAGYRVLMGFASCSVPLDVVMTMNAGDADMADVIIEIDAGESIRPADSTDTTLTETASEGIRDRLADVESNLTELASSFAESVEDSRPGTGTAAIVVTGAVVGHLEEDSRWLEAVFDGDLTALPPLKRCLEDAEPFNNVDADELATLYEDLEAALEPLESVTTSADTRSSLELRSWKKRLEIAALELHLGAIEAFGATVRDTTLDEFRSETYTDLTTIEETYLAAIEDPGRQLGTLPLVRRITGAIPGPSPRAAQESIADAKRAVRADMLEVLFTGLDAQMESTLEEWGPFLDERDETIRRSYLDASSVFEQADMWALTVGQYRRQLIVGAIVVLIAVGVGGGWALLG